MDFKTAVKELIKLEGGLSDQEFDKGGLTKSGITQATYDAWRIAQGLSPKSVAEIYDSEVYAIYSQWYWIPSGGSKLPDGLDFAVFQAAVVHGVKPALKMLQEILGVTVDGIFGDQTLNAVNAYISTYGANHLVDMFLANQIEKFGTIVADDFTQKKFYAGWLNRVMWTKEIISTLAIPVAIAAAPAIGATTLGVAASPILAVATLSIAAIAAIKVLKMKKGKK